jgi:carboxymethylenebutenolidase
MGEEIQITSRDSKSFAAYLAQPENTPAPGIVLLPEVFNTNPHIRSVSHGYAADGFTVIAPNVYWRQEPGAYLAYTDEGRAKAQSLRALLNTDQFAMDLEDTVAALRERNDFSGRVGVMGFCLGVKFAYLSSVRHAIDAAVSYYGVQIDQHLDEAQNLKCPLLMHFAETDPHVPTETVEAICSKFADETRVDIHVYPGTEHGFNRYGYPPHNEAQSRVARDRTIAHFRRHLSA